jgi:hypothetical protein
MMGSRGKLSGDEVDAFCARHRSHWRAGVAKAIKRGFSRRMRKAAKHDLTTTSTTRA